MRPIIRGPCPADENGKNMVFTEYTQARRALIERIGERCSYCEMHLDASLAVEHVKPKNPSKVKHNQPTSERELDWNNFLLACTNCNSIKGDADVLIEDYIWPDRDNTFMALNYSEGGRVTPSEGPYKTRAQHMINLVGLDRTPQTASASDRRWQNRRETWDIAQESLRDLNENDSPALRRQIIRTIKAGAYWSIWFTVFKNHPEILKEMIAAIPGTATSCFDPKKGYSPISCDLAHGFTDKS